MAMRLHELHPSLVHFPIALLPTSIGSDLVGTLTRSRRLLELGCATRGWNPRAEGAGSRYRGRYICRENCRKTGRARGGSRRRTFLGGGDLLPTVTQADIEEG